MQFRLACECGATAWAKGGYEPDVNATNITDDDIEWEGGKPDCEHEDFTIIDEEYDDPPEN